MTLRTYIKRQKRALDAVDPKSIPHDVLDSILVEPKIWRILHADKGVLSAAGCIPAHRRMSAFINRQVINAPNQLRNVAEEIVLLYQIGHCVKTSEMEIDAWTWARKHATRQSKKYVDEIAPRALARCSRYESRNHESELGYVEY